MLDRLFGGDGLTAATRALDAASLRQQAIANNLANVNTPGYKRQQVQFEDSLSAALAKGPGAVDSVRPRLVTVGSTSERQDGNNVDMESEMVDLATNQLNYEVLSQQIGGYFSTLKSVIKGS